MTTVSQETDLLFIHTINGRPGYFDGEQIVFGELRGHWIDSYNLIVPRHSVNEIMNDQRRSEAYRHKHRWDVPDYDYIIVALGRRRHVGRDEFCPEVEV